jgi:hypothetical protein
MSLQSMPRLQVSFESGYRGAYRGHRIALEVTRSHQFPVHDCISVTRGDI